MRNTSRREVHNALDRQDLGRAVTVLNDYDCVGFSIPEPRMYEDLLDYRLMLGIRRLKPGPRRLLESILRAYGA